MKKAILLGLLLALAPACKTLPGCPRAFCDYREDLTHYGRNVRVFYEDSFRQAGSCSFRAELATGQFVPSNQQEATTVLRNLAGTIQANAIVMQSFRANRDATARAYFCTDTAGRQMEPAQTLQNPQPSQQIVIQQPQQQQQIILQPAQQQQQQTALPQSRLTVADHARRLSWQQCSMGQTSQGGRCSGQATSEMYQTAQAYCASLSSGNLQYRLPDRAELAALLRETASGPKIDAGAFPDTKADVYWTRESYNGSPITNWVVDFGGGGSFGYGTDNQAYTRCVAANP
jgi:hypothetical protein